MPRTAAAGLCALLQGDTPYRCRSTDPGPGMIE
jgi:hypothetical protein